MAARRRDPGGLEDQGQEVRVGEVAIIHRVFLRPHAARLALGGVPQPGFLPDGAAGTREVLKHMRQLVWDGKNIPALRDFAQSLMHEMGGRVVTYGVGTRLCIHFSCNLIAHF